MSALVILGAILVVVNARPSEYLAKNVVTVPPNCPDGQEWINGQCRDVWRAVYYDTYNVVTVPPNCPEGQEYINGQCRDIWRTNEVKNSATIALNCFPSLLINGRCLSVRSQAKQAEMSPTNVVTVPDNCPQGQQYINGQCRDVWRVITDSRNTVTVPPNCPNGQEFVNGQCRDIWRGTETYSDLLSKITSTFANLDLLRSKRDTDEEDPQLLPEITNRNIISVPNQCPAGSRPDTLGICRPIFD